MIIINDLSVLIKFSIACLFIKVNCSAFENISIIINNSTIIFVCIANISNVISVF